MDDNYILEHCFCKNGNVLSKLRRLIDTDEYKDIKQYLEKRFSDSSSIKETLWRISHKIYERPICPVCGGPLIFYGKCHSGYYDNGYSKTCSKDCRYKLSKQHCDETMIKEFGVPCNFMRDDVKQNVIKIRNESDFYEKRKSTVKEKYGVEYAFHQKEAKEKANESFVKYANKMKEANDRVRIAMLTGDYSNVSDEDKRCFDKTQETVDKIEKTKEKNKTVYSSKAEDDLYNILSSKYKDIIRNRKHPLYPHKCDFYIKDIDLYIEYQGSIFHQFEPYIEDSDRCKDKLMKLKFREAYSLCILNKEYNRYSGAIENWTKTDVLKRNEAKQNKLNFLEIFPKFKLNAILDFLEKEYPVGTTNKQMIIGQLK